MGVLSIFVLTTILKMNLERYTVIAVFVAWRRTNLRRSVGRSGSSHGQPRKCPSEDCDWVFSTSPVSSRAADADTAETAYDQSSESRKVGGLHATDQRLVSVVAEATAKNS